MIDIDNRAPGHHAMTSIALIGTIYMTRAFASRDIAIVTSGA